MQPPPRPRQPGRLPTPDIAVHGDAEAEADEPETGPLRRCLVTREHGERARMMRFVLGPDRQIVADLAARLPGRGMWLSARADVIEAARARGAFARAARGPVAVPADLHAQVVNGLERRIADHLGLARRAGQAVAGFARAREWLAAGRAAGVIQAADGSEAERSRLLGGSASKVWVASPMSAAALGGIFGRDVAVHVVVAPGRLAETLRTELERLAGVTGREILAGVTGREILGGVTGRVITNRAGE